MSVSHMQCKHGRSEGGRVCLFQLNLSRWGRWGLQLLQKPIRLSRKIWITPNQHHDMEHFYFSIDFHHSMFYWKRKVKLKLRKRNYFDSHHGVLISLCSGSSQIGHPLLPYLGLIHIQAYSQPYLDKIQNIIRGLCHCWCFNQQVLLFLFTEFDNAANVEIKETELFFSLRGNLKQRGESD